MTTLRPWESLLRIGNCAAFAAFGLSFFTPGQSSAANANIPFSGTVVDSCSITLDANGVLGPRPDYQVINSRVANGGSPGRATVFASASGFTLNYDTPSAFDSQPSADTSPETFDVRFRSVGATTFAETDVPQAMNAGSSTVRVVLIARKAPSDTFAAGSYSATVVLRCE